MSKYPLILLFRHATYSFVDNFIEENKDKYDCSFFITDRIDDLKKLFDTNYHMLVNVGQNMSEYNYMINDVPERFGKSWIFKTVDDFKNIEQANSNFNYNYIFTTIGKRESTRPKFSIFTTCYKSYHYIDIAYKSIIGQTFDDWEWVIMDDSPEDEHFVFLRKTLSHDPRVRLYKRQGNSGNIGNVKNEAVSLCRGKYVLEMDHDDEILCDCLTDSYNIFEKDESVGFVYADFINKYRDGRNFEYGGGLICRGYASYYYQKIKNEWRPVFITANINNITLTHLTCLPNHPRMWRRSALMECENYSERLPICDDYEILLRTLTKYKVVKNNKIQYIQYMNDNGNNFSYIRNEEINRLGPNYIAPIYFTEYDVHNTMKRVNAYEDPKYIGHHSNIWKREEEYKHYRHNKIINYDYDKQYCIINDEIHNPDLVKLYENTRCDFIFLSNTLSIDQMTRIIDEKQFDRMKCYSLLDCNNDELVKLFTMLYANDNCQYEILIDNVSNSTSTNNINTNINNTNNTNKFITIYNSRHDVINSIISERGTINNYLEIGVEYGITIKYVKALHKIGVDPDPKFENTGEFSNIQLIKETSDAYFAQLDEDRIVGNDRFDIIFIDGMHQIEYMIKDIYNSLRYIKPNGIIFIDDILPFNEREQRKIPEKHYYENGILKYGEPWTGDVWKVFYYLLLNFKENFDFQVYDNSWYRGVCMLYNIKPFDLVINDNVIEIINNYRYVTDFNAYKKLLLI